VDPRVHEFLPISNLLDLLTASFTITHNHNQSQKLAIFSQSLLPGLSRTHSILVLILVSRWTSENITSYTVVFTAHSIATGVIRLLPVYSLPWCVYQAVAQQWVYMSQ
jgi:hypothetical protein